MAAGLDEGEWAADHDLQRILARKLRSHPGEQLFRTEQGFSVNDYGSGEDLIELLLYPPRKLPLTFIVWVNLVRQTQSPKGARDASKNLETQAM